MEPVSVRKEKKVRVGDRAPDFTLPDQTGKPVQLRDLLGRGTVVLYFYPKDETPGCTLEARAFRDSYDRFTARGAEVVGISSDSVAAHRRFAARHGLPFLFLSDRGASVPELYGREDQGVGAGRDARRSVADGLVLERERRRAGRAAAILVVERTVEGGAHGDVELGERLRVFAPQVQVEPRLLGDGVESGTSAEPHDGAGRAGSGGGGAAGQVGEQRGGAADRVRGIGDAERGPRVAAGPAKCDAVALGAERPVHHALEPRAVERDEGGGLAVSRFLFPVQQVLDAPQIPRSFFADGGGEQHRPSCGHARDDHGFSHGDERGQAARVVADARALEPLATPRDGDVDFGAEYGVQVGG